MPTNVKAIPDGYHTVTPYLIINGAAAAIDFYKQAFGAKELFRMPQPDGKIGHAEIKIGDSPIMLADEHPEMGHVSPKTLGGSPVSILDLHGPSREDRKSTRLNSSHQIISYAVFCLKKKKTHYPQRDNA